MKCPRCEKTMLELSNNDVKLDVCFDGCGGIWFDPYEFKKVDEKHEADEAFLLKLSQSSNNFVNVTDKIDCPVCDSQPMVRRFFSVKKQVELDECPKCAGFWLDAGELTQIYSTFSTEVERIQAAGEFFDEMFGKELSKLQEESLKDLKKAQSVAKSLRFICPSYYIPGKQDWGAF